MNVSQSTNLDTERARQLWAEYQRQHDVSSRKGQSVGIDPVSGRIWFGDSIAGISRQLDAEGIATPLFFVRVGTDHYYRKRGRR